jgi:hypothetical protein
VSFARRLLRGLGLGVAALATGASIARHARADSARVSLVRPNTSNASAREALNRIQGELTAEGFEVVIVDAPPSLEAESNGSDPGAIANIELVVDAEEHAAELRVIDRLTNKTVIRRTTIEAPEGPRFAQVLAVRAVELLRASLVELLLRSRAAPAVATTPAAKFAVERATKFAASSLELPRQSPLGIDAGTAVLFGFSGIGPALLAVLRVRAAFGSSLQFRASLAGLGTQPRVAAPRVGNASVGSASVNEQVGLVELAARLRPASVVHPVATIGLGALHLAVDGEPAFSYVARQSSGWSFAADAGIGVELRVNSHFDVSLETHAFITEPRQVIRFLDQQGPGVGQPSLLGALTIVGWL